MSILERDLRADNLLDRIDRLRQDVDLILRRMALAPVGNRYLEVQTTWDPGNIKTAETTNTSVTVPGAQSGWLAAAALSSLGAVNVILAAHVSGDDTVQVVLYNGTGADYNASSGTLRVRVWVG